jgi:energy-coupling factor transporter ATP-binding protein EcfA2
MYAVKMAGLNFSYPQKPVLKGISLEIKKGEFAGIIGKTGCGKSTLLLTMNGIIPQMVKGDFSGKVEILGRDATRTPVHELARFVAFVFQDPDDQLFSLRVEDEVLFGLSNLGIKGEEAKRRVKDALKTVDLDGQEDSDPHLLSYGQKQKLAFACALAVEPEIFVLDEPVSSLDHSGAEEIYSILKQLNKSGKTIIISEHDTEWLAESASRILFLNNGTIEADGGPSLLFERKIEQAGIKVPCAVKISKELGKEFLTPDDFVRGMKPKRNK